jgi:hypothetical protein
MHFQCSFLEFEATFHSNVFVVLSNQPFHTQNNKHSLRSNTKGYGGKTHKIDSQNNDTIALNGKELYHFQFLL